MAKILITSALPYVNNIPHLGNLIGSVLSADCFARFARLDGNEVLFVLGTDEYGTTTVTKAMEEGVTPRELADKYFEIHKKIYDGFLTSYDCLGRSTSKENAKIVQDIFLKLYKNGYFVEHTIQQLYSEKSKMFLSDRFVEGECPYCHAEGARGDQCDACGKLLDQKDLINPVSKVDGTRPIMRETKHLYIDLPKLEPKLREWIVKHENDWSSLAKSITYSWLNAGLRERSITRDLEWGIPVPLEEWKGKVFYSWFDAPIAYIGITNACIGDKWKEWWFDKNIKLYQYMGKDNVPFHTIMFPSYLIGTGEDYKLVDVLDSTAYLNYENKKFSKSKSVGVFGDDVINSGIAIDLWRYYLFRMRPENFDTEFMWDDFFAKINNELVGNYGNFVNRVISLTYKFFDGKKPKKLEAKLIGDAEKLFIEYKELMKKSKLKEGLDKANEISSLGNKYIQEKEPWILAKTNLDEAGEVIANCIDLCKILALIYYPYLPKSSEIVWKAIVKKEIKSATFGQALEEVIVGESIEQIGVLFQKLEKEKIEEMKQKFN
jgi:methionyl-tRNA synthetase